MKISTQNSAIRIFRKHGGTLRTSEILRLGVHPRTLYQLRDNSQVIELSRGIYRLAELSPLENSDLIVAAKRVPMGVICLISALSFHNITSEVPHEVYLAIPTGREKPKLDHPPARGLPFFARQLHSRRRKTHPGRQPRQNLFKGKNSRRLFYDSSENRIGLDVALEALRLCIGKGGYSQKDH